jgi:hypothetical protein
VVVTVIALMFLAVHLLWPQVPIDTVALLLLLGAVLPWLSDLIKSAELPGGFKIEFKDVQSAGDKVTKPPAQTKALRESPAPSYVKASDLDPNLAVVGLRIEIEKRLRALADKHGIPDTRSISSMLRGLREAGVLDASSAGGLQELVSAGNQAAHGASVDPEAARWAIDQGPAILAALDDQL